MAQDAFLVCVGKAGADLGASTASRCSPTTAAHRAAIYGARHRYRGRPEAPGGESRIAEDGLAVWARGWGVPRSIGIALSRLGRSQRRGQSSDARGISRRARGHPSRLELALALGDLGSTLRRDNHRAAARDPLRRALDLAAGCRADALAKHLRAEFARGRRQARRDALRGKDALTASELRIAELAATGNTNSQIAQAIFVTPATVEKHLTSVYS